MWRDWLWIALFCFTWSGIVAPNVPGGPFTPPPVSLPSWRLCFVYDNDTVREVELDGFNDAFASISLEFPSLSDQLDLEYEFIPTTEETKDCLPLWDCDGIISYGPNEITKEIIDDDTLLEIVDCGTDFLKKWEEKPYLVIGTRASGFGLSHMASFPYFYRVVPADDLVAMAMAGVFKEYGWISAVVIHTDTPHGASSLHMLTNHLKAVDVAVEEVMMLRESSFFIDELILELKALKPRHVVVMGDGKQLSTFYERAVEAGVFEVETTWVVSSPTLECLVGDAAVVSPSDVEGMIVVTTLSPDNVPDVLSDAEELIYVAEIYDAVHAYASALSNSVDLGQDPYDIHQMWRRLLVTNFPGRSGNMFFDEVGNRMHANLTIFQATGGLPGIEKRGYFDTSAETLHVSQVLADSSSSGDAAPYKFVVVPSFGTPPERRIRLSNDVSRTLGMIVVFGGTDGVSAYNDLHVYNFVQRLWSEEEQIGSIPDERFGAFGGMISTYFVVYGGVLADNTISTDVYVFDFDLESWKSRDIESPPARREFAAATIQNGFVIYGGYTPYDDVSVYNDLWMFDLSDWAWTELVPSSGSPPRLQAAMMIASPTWDQLYIFGGTFDWKHTEDRLYRYVFETNTWEDMNITTVGNTTDLEGEEHTIGRALGSMDFYRNHLLISFGYVATANDTVAVRDMWAINVDCPGPDCAASSLLIPMADLRNMMTRCPTYRHEMYCFGGWNLQSYLNNLVTVRLDDLTEVVNASALHGSLDRPEGRYGHGNTMMSALQYLIFGGINEFGDFLPDLWMCNVVTGDWEKMTNEASEAPVPRAYTTMTSFGDIAVIYGGMDASGGSLNDVWMYSTLMHQWILIEPSTATQGEPLAYHTMATFGTRSLWVYGGQDSGIDNRGTFSFDLGTSTWTHLHEFDSNSDRIPATRFGLSIPWDHFIFYIGGETAVSEPSAEVWAFDLDMNMWFAVQSQIRRPFSSALCGIFGDRFLLYGGRSKDHLVTDIYYLYASYDYAVEVSEETKMGNVTSFIPVLQRVDVDVSSSAYVPHFRASAGGGAVNNGLLLHGGMSARSGEYIDMLVLGDLTILTPSDFCAPNDTMSEDCWHCSLGAVHVPSTEVNGTCSPCPAGYYGDVSGGTECTPCPEGFYNPHDGATSLEHCFPCKTDTLARHSGSAMCSTCPPDKFCPMATVSALPTSMMQIYSELRYNETQPLPYDSKEKTDQLKDVTDQLVLAGIIMTCLLATTCLVLGRFERGKEFLTRADYFFSGDHGVITERGYLVDTPNPFGGSFTIWYWMLAFVLGGMVASQFFIDNLLEVRTLEPRVLVMSSEVEKDELAGNVTSKVVFESPIGCAGDKVAFTTDSPALVVEVFEEFGISYDDTNLDTMAYFECADFVHVYVDGLDPLGENGDVDSEVDIGCFEMEAGVDRSLCEVMIDCYNCNFGESMGVIEISSGLPDSFSSFFIWSVDAASGYPNEDSALWGISVPPDSNHVFHGPWSTNVSVEIVPTVYQDVHTNYKESGHHVNFISMDIGDVATSEEFHTKVAMEFTFAFHRDDEVLEVTRSRKATLISALSEGFGLITGISVFLVTLMVWLEGLSDSLQRGRLYAAMSWISYKLTGNHLPPPPKKKKPYPDALDSSLPTLKGGVLGPSFELPTYNGSNGYDSPKHGFGSVSSTVHRRHKDSNPHLLETVGSINGGTNGKSHVADVATYGENPLHAMHGNGGSPRPSNAWSPRPQSNGGGPQSPYEPPLSPHMNSPSSHDRRPASNGSMAAFVLDVPDTNGHSNGELVQTVRKGGETKGRIRLSNEGGSVRTVGPSSNGLRRKPDSPKSKSSRKIFAPEPLEGEVTSGSPRNPPKSPQTPRNLGSETRTSSHHLTKL